MSAQTRTLYMTVSGICTTLPAHIRQTELAEQMDMTAWLSVQPLLSKACPMPALNP